MSLGSEANSANPSELDHYLEIGYVLQYFLSSRRSGFNPPQATMPYRTKLKIICHPLQKYPDGGENSRSGYSEGRNYDFKVVLLLFVVLAGDM